MTSTRVVNGYNKLVLKSTEAFASRSEKLFYPLVKAEWGPFVLNAGDRTKSLGVPIARCAGMESGDPTARRIVAALNAVRHFPTAVLEDPNFNVALDLVIAYNILQRQRSVITTLSDPERSDEIRSIRIAYQDAKAIGRSL